MKLKQITLATAIALAAPAAFAAAPTGPYDTTGAVVVYLSGATAPDEFMESIVTGMMNAGFYKYKDAAGGTKTFRAFLGEVKNDASIPASIRNQKVLFIKRSKGGSVFGVNPVARAEGLSVLNVLGGTAGGCSSAAATDGYYTCPVVGVDPGVGTSTGQEMVPDFGVSDVAPFMFKEPLNVEFGASQLTAAETGGMTVRSVNTLMMGIVATAAVPSSAVLTEADYAAMLTGNITNWSKVGAGVSIPAGNQVVVCRRWPGSGTQTSYNWYFNNFPCTSDSALSGVSGSVPPARMDSSAGYGVGGTGTSADPYIIDVTAGYTVIENSGSGDVRACLNAAQSAVDYAFQAEDGTYWKANFSAAGGALGAIGVLSLDSQEQTGAATSSGVATSKGAESAWFFRTLNGAGVMAKNTSGVADETCSSSGTLSGVCPNRSALREGQYEFAAELTMQYRTGLSGQKLDFANEFIDRAGDPGFQKPWTLALPPTYSPNATVAVEGYDGGLVAKATRNGNMCKPLSKTF